MSTNNQSSDSTATEQTDDEPVWSFDRSDMELRKVSYSKYELVVGSITVPFSEVREKDDRYELRDDSYNTVATVDKDEDFPDNISTAFTVLVNEI